MKKIISILWLSIVFSAIPTTETGSTSQFSLDRIGDYAFPSNPVNDRAMGFLLEGKIKSIILNSGNFIDIDVDRSGSWEQYPVGLWGNYAYLPQVGLMSGAPGMKYASDFSDWEDVAEIGSNIVIWESRNAYINWFKNEATISDSTKGSFAGIIFENFDDHKGELGEKVDFLNTVENTFTDENQWAFNHAESFIYIALENDANIDPNLSNAYGNPEEKKAIGFIYPWALRPAFDSRNSVNDYDTYLYDGCQGKEDPWSICEEVEYYGTTVSESWFQRSGYDLDWHPANKARINTHSLNSNAGDVFGSTPYTDSGDENPLLAHSKYSETWPTLIDEETGEEFSYWPGWYAENYIDTLSGCSGTKKDPDCWQQDIGRFVSDNDVYLEFDDRWAHRGNRTNNAQDALLTKGYPLGLRVMATGHSYGVAFAEDVMFVTTKVRNESGDWCAFSRDSQGNKIYKYICTNPQYFTQDECEISGATWEQECGDAMIMPDGTRMNGRQGFDYEGVSLGFYFDADAATQDIDGDTWVHSNDDDFMEYYDDRPIINNEELIISMAMIYDYDGISSGATDLGIVAVQLLDSPYATDTIWVGTESNPQLFRLPGERLKMTDWHWFDWFQRPGVMNAGASSTPGYNKEEIQYKLMVGDTTNISENEKAWYFHTPNPLLDNDYELDPHFDSLEGLELEESFTEGPDGLDCVLISSCGPFDLEVGEEVPFSFTIIFGEDKDDLIKNAEFAQVMYNSHYQGYTPPTKPNIYANIDHERVEITWDLIAESSTDVVTGYSDFEGYKLYKSKDGGMTWGDPEDKIYDVDGIHVGWQPIAQFDLTAEEDSTHCIYSDDECTSPDSRGAIYSGADPSAPWFSLGNNTGLEHTFVDTSVIDGIEYTYSITAYDTGLDPDYTICWDCNPPDTIYHDDGSYHVSYEPDTTWNSSNPDHWSSPDGYQSIESSKGTTILDPSFVTVIPGYKASNITFPESEEVNELFVANEGVVGTGDKHFSMVNVEDLIDSYMKFEIDAVASDEVYENMAVDSPLLFAFEVDNPTDQNPLNTFTFSSQADTLNADTLSYYLGFPGAFNVNNELKIPVYNLEAYELPYEDDYDFETNWTQIFNGLRFKFDNMPFDRPTGDFVVIYDLEWGPDVDSTVIKSVDVSLEYQSSADYAKGLNFDYKIEFSDSSYLDISTTTSPSSGCFNYDDNNETPIGIDGKKTLLPLKITNLKSENVVELIHLDKGITNDGSTQNDVEGYKDCVWTRNEMLSFKRDYILVGDEVDDEKTYELYLDIDLEEAFPDLNFIMNASGQEIAWNELDEYPEYSYVLHEGMVWKATENIPAYINPDWENPVYPGEYFDSTEGDGEEFDDNPWKIQYPWKHGDYVIVKPKKFFVDRDSWVVDMSKFGEEHDVTQAEIDQVREVPNPYIAKSDFNESEYVRKLRFTNLPQHCTITIYTVSGEKVIDFDHDNEYDSNEFWNLRTVNNQEVAPGLYLFTVESTSGAYRKHIGKFSVVR